MSDHDFTFRLALHQTQRMLEQQASNAYKSGATRTAASLAQAAGLYAIATVLQGDREVPEAIVATKQETYARKRETIAAANRKVEANGHN